MLFGDRSPIRILLAEDHQLFREGLGLIIKNQPHFRIAAEAGARLEALAAAEREQPDVILLDPALDEGNNFELLQELLMAAKQARILLLSRVNNPDEHSRAIRLGAMGIILKEDDARTLIKAIEKVYAGEVWLEPRMAARLLTEMLRKPEVEKADPELEKIASITHREREVVTLIGGGLKNKQIADRLCISEVTVRHHLTSIFSKLEVKDRLELAIYAYRYGLAKPPFCR